MKDVAAAMWTEKQLLDQAMWDLAEVQWHIMHPPLPHQDYTTMQAMHTGVLRAQKLTGLDELAAIARRLKRQCQELRQCSQQENPTGQQLISRRGG